MKKILKEFGVLLIVLFMVFSSIAIADTNVKINKSNNKTTNNSSDNLGLIQTKETTDTIIDAENFVWDGVNAQWVDADDTGEAHRVPINTEVWLKFVIHNQGPSYLLDVHIDSDLLQFEFFEADPPPDYILIDPPWVYMEWDAGNMWQDEKFEVIIRASVLGPVTQYAVFDVYANGKDEWAQPVDDLDYCYILPYKTPRNKAIQTSPFINLMQNFLQCHPNLFPILRQLLGLLN
jgi:hypothetical protein